MTGSFETLGFPAPLLGTESHRLPILGVGPGWTILDKPQGMVSHAHPAFKEAPALDRAMQTQARAGKPEWLRKLPGVCPGIKSCYFLEPELGSAPALFSWDPALLSVLRNAQGSRLYTFRFLLFARDRKSGEGPRRTCALPLTDPSPDPSSVRVSHRRGKSAETRFELVEVFGDHPWGLWRAESRLVRPGQLAVHALESGLAIAGEATHAKEPPICRESFFRKRRSDATPLLRGPAFRLAAVDYPTDWGKPEGTMPCGQVSAPEPKEWTAILRKLRA